MFRCGIRSLATHEFLKELLQLAEAFTYMQLTGMIFAIRSEAFQSTHG